MSQRCPVCKTRLWTDPLFGPTRLKCPRCGAVFRPTVPFVYFRILLLVVLAMLVVFLVFVPARRLWAFVVFLVVLSVIFGLLPRVIDLQRISAKMPLPEGAHDSEELDLEWKNRVLADEEEEERHLQSRFRMATLVLILVSLVILLLAITQFFS